MSTTPRTLTEFCGMPTEAFGRHLAAEDATAQQLEIISQLRIENAALRRGRDMLAESIKGANAEERSRAEIMAAALNAMARRVNWQADTFDSADERAVANVVVHKGYSIAKEYAATNEQR